ncbi:MAG: DUF459 domain-containing protein [Anaerolineae bacterium]
MDESESNSLTIRRLPRGRLLSLLALLVALAAAVALLSTAPRARADGGSHVLVAGDSFAGPVALELRKFLRSSPDVTVRTDFRVASGLAHPDFYDWPARMQWDLATDPPDVVVLLLGTNDTMAMRVGRQFFSPGTPSWREEYGARVGGMMDMVGQAGAQMVWVAPPVMRDDWRNDMVAIINDVIAEQAAQRPWVRYVDTRPLLSDTDGSFALALPDADGNMVQVRKTDGIHLTWDGSHWVAGLIYRVLTQNAGTSGVTQAVADDAPAPTATPTPTPPPPPPDKHPKKK